MNNRTIPSNLTGQMAEAWNALQARADENGVVTLTADEVVNNLEMLAAVGGCVTEDQADGTKKVTLTYAEAPAEAPVVDVDQAAAATKKTEFAGTGSPETRDVR